MISNRCFILGGGSSIRMGLWNTPIDQLPIWQWLRGEFVIGTNFSELFFPSTALVCQDYKFIETQEWINKVPLVITTDLSYSKLVKHEKVQPNIISTNNLEWQLSGMAALSLAIKIGVPEIFLLGKDATEINGHTHFYDDTNIGTYKYQGKVKSGIGKKDNGQYKTGNYNNIKELNNHYYKPFEQALKDGVKIYNVSPLSKITTFPKMNYKQLFSYLNYYPEIVEENEIRDEIRKQVPKP